MYCCLFSRLICLFAVLYCTIFLNYIYYFHFSIILHDTIFIGIMLFNIIYGVYCSVLTFLRCVIIIIIIIMCVSNVNIRTDW